MILLLLLFFILFDLNFTIEIQNLFYKGVLAKKTLKVSLKKE